MSAFTPGPWEAYTKGAAVPAVRAVGELERVDGGHIASCASYSSEAEAKANAHLIAAAPELYEALEMAGQSAGFQYMTEETREAIDAAIAKAEGKP